MTLKEINAIVEKCKRLGFNSSSVEELIDAFIIYLRKSRKDEEIERYIKMENPNVTKEELDIEILKRHENQIQAYAKETLGFKIPDKNIYRELKSGGELDERPVMQEILKEIENPSRLGVLVYDIDRIGRPNTLDLGIIAQAFELTDTKILVASPPKIWDLTDDFDREYFEDSLRQARKFLNYTKTKMTNGRKQSVREGKYIGSVAPWGYDRYKLPNQKGWSLKPNADSEYVKDVFHKYVYEGYSYVSLSNYLNENNIKPPGSDAWQPPMINRVLKRDAYAGYVTYGKTAFKNKMADGKKIRRRIKQDEYIRTKGLHYEDAIIDEDTFNKAQEIAKNKGFSNVPKTYELQNPFTGLMRCKCGFVMVKGKIKKAKYVKSENQISAEDFVSYYKERRKELKLTNVKISQMTGLSVGSLKHYGNLGCFHFPSKKNYLKIKKALQMDDRFDDIINYEVVYDVIHTLNCSNITCKCVSSYIEVVEKELLKQLREKIKASNLILDNYEQDEIQVIKDHKKDIERVQREIEGLRKQISVACDMLEKKVYTEDIFINRINELNKKISVKEEKIKELESLEVEKEIIQHKKQIPILENVINHYDELTAEEKNELLKTFINKITYYKETKISQTTIKDSGKISLDIDFKDF